MNLKTDFVIDFYQIKNIILEFHDNDLFLIITFVTKIMIIL